MNMGLQQFCWNFLVEFVGQTTCWAHVQHGMWVSYVSLALLAGTDVPFSWSLL